MIDQGHSYSVNCKVAILLYSECMMSVARCLMGDAEKT